LSNRGLSLIFLATLALAPAAMAFDLQGHRGARGLAPENTLPAFATALSLGVSTLELDVGVTADGVVVIAHDRRLNPDITRDAAGNWLAHPAPTIRSLTFAQLQGYDVGRIKPGIDYERRYPQQKAMDGVRMPRLAGLFAMLEKSGNKAVRLNIETKLSPLAPEETLDPEAFARALIEVVRAAGMDARVTVQSFDWRSLKAVQKLAPGIATSCLTAQQRWLDNIGAGSPTGSPWVAGYQLKDLGSIPRMVKAAGCGTWSPFMGDIDKAKVAEAQALGLKVLPWTVNEPAHLRAVLDLGVDGLITDRPDLARQALAERGIALPPPSPVQP
jgi:glycerophosphoryl diester phosphodiesterase